LTTSQFLTIPALENMQGISHAFTTRKNGLGARINGIKSPSDWDAVASAFNVNTDRVVTVNQVHGDDIVIVHDNNYRAMRNMEADALITSSAGLAIGVETADCVPILLVDSATPAVAAVHAGWRSTVKKILQKTIARMQKEFGSEPSRLTAVIGPAIGPECYEVDEPVMGAIGETFPFWKELAAPRGNGKWSLDLVKANRMQLIQAGLFEKDIHPLGMCTSCRRDLFYSFRAEGRTGRMLSAVMIKA
jgi:purine-nucleoside/S-methyl-5'-thioadenosine phosphorylase / adenosine deaminase